MTKHLHLDYDSNMDKLFRFCCEGLSSEAEVMLQDSTLTLDINDSEYGIGTAVAKYGKADVLKALIKYGLDLSNKSITMLAVYNGYEECVKLLLSASANIEGIESTTPYDNYPSIKDLIDEYPNCTILGANLYNNS